MDNNQSNDAATETAGRGPDAANAVTSDFPADPIQDEPKEPESSETEKEDAAPVDAKDKTEEEPEPNDQDSATDTSKTSRSERRQKKLVKKLTTAEQRIAELLEQNQQLRAQADKPAESKPDEPQMSDFEDQKEFLKAHADWSKPQVKEPDAKPEPKSKPRASDADIAEFQARGVEEFGEDFSEALDDDPDDPALAVNETMGSYFFNSDKGPAIYMHLYDNPTKAKEIYFTELNSDDPVKAKRETRKALKALEAELGEKPKKPAVKTTKASEPPSGDDKGNTPIVKDPENETMAEYAKRRKQEMSASTH